MAKERKTRQARKKIDTSSLKEFGAGDDFQSRGQQKLAFAKTVKEEADSVQTQVEEEQAKAQEKSLWSSIGGALGGLAVGLATGGAGWVTAGIGAGLGTYGFAQVGKALSEKKSGKRKEITSNMFYENEAHKQNLAFSEFDDKLNDSILTRSLAAGVMAAAFTGGGKLIEKMKEGKSSREAAKAASASNKAKEGLRGYETPSYGNGRWVGDPVLKKEGLGLSAELKKAKEGAEFVMNTDISSSGVNNKLASSSGLSSDISVASGYDNIVMDKTLGKSSYEVTEALAESIGMGGDDIFANSNLAFREGSQNFMTSSFTPLADEIGPSIMDSYLKGIAGQKSKSMQQSLLAAGGMSLYGYRPELDSLRQVQFGTNIKPYG